MLSVSRDLLKVQGALFSAFTILYILLKETLREMFEDLNDLNYERFEYY